MQRISEVMDEATIPWSRLAAFVRQHTHDVRNGLNSLDLETALLHELAPTGEVSAAVDRIRKQLRSVVQQLRSLSASFQDLQPIAAPIPARVLFKIWREKCVALTDAPEVLWEDRLGDEEVKVDVEMMAAVFSELLVNAARFSQGAPATITSRLDDGAVVFELIEPKNEAVNPGTWGQPFTSTRRGAYGLGLWTARRMTQANGANLTQQFSVNNCCLITTITIPAL